VPLLRSVSDILRFKDGLHLAVTSSSNSSIYAEDRDQTIGRLQQLTFIIVTAEKGVALEARSFCMWHRMAHPLIPTTI